MSEKKVNRISTNMNALFQTVAKDCKSMAVTFGFTQISNSMKVIAERAIETRDQKILTELYYLGVVTLPDEMKKEFGIN